MPDILSKDTAEVVPGSEVPTQSGEVTPVAAVSEKIPVPASQPSQDDDSSDSTDVVSIAKDFSDVKPNVVDMRTNQGVLDPIKDTSHKLTVEADVEEEEFITHVEEVHTIAE